MDKRSLGTAALVAGVVLALLAILADTLGIGGEDVFGWKQAVVLALGLVLGLLGAGLLAGVVSVRGITNGREPSPRPGADKASPPPD